VLGKCAALHRNALISKHDILRAHLTDFIMLADLAGPILRPADELADHAQIETYPIGRPP